MRLIPAYPHLGGHRPKKRRKRRSTAHPGFEAEARSISRREHLPMRRARAILASSSRRASPAAKRRNPRLKRVKGRKA